MYILNNALRNIVRNKGRNILVGLVLLAIIGTSVVGLVINGTASAIIDDYRTRFGSEVTIGFDIECMMAHYDLTMMEVAQMARGGGGFNMNLAPDELIAIAQSQYLMGYEMTATKTVGNDDLMAIDETDSGGGGGFFMHGGSGFEGDAFITPKFRVLGNHWEEFETGERFLADGRMPQYDGEVLISQELAELNALSVGDVITVHRSTITPVEDTMEFRVRNVASDFTVVGIYVDMTEPLGQFAGLGIAIQNPMMNRRNEILTTTATLLDGVADGGIQLESTFFLADPAYLPYFEAEVYAITGNRWLTVSTDINNFNRIVEPVEGLRAVSVTFVVVVLVLGAVILILLTGIAIRERKYEIGVLRAMGMKKGKVARGLLYEMAILTAVCLVFGLGIGTVAAQPVADNLLRRQPVGSYETAPQSNQMVFAPGGGGGVRQLTAFGGTEPDELPLSEITVRLGLYTLLQIAGIALLLGVVASTMGIISITRYEPIKILTERD